MPLKGGSGDLDFSGDDGDDQHQESLTDDATDDQHDSPTDGHDGTMREGIDRSFDADDHEYPYFVRRDTVGEERDERIEVHLRSAVSDREAGFREALAKALETDEVAKTDAREFALKYAFENPEAVARLMREEGYGATD